MRVAICDDENEIRDMIERKIHSLYPMLSVEQFDSGQALLEKADQFDIIFLDIQMEGINGMEAARAIRKRGSQMILIFITAIEEYVFQAYDVGAFHYLVKPFEQAKFLEVLQRAVQEQKQRQILKDKEEKSILIKMGAVTQKVYLKDIMYVEVFNRKCILHKVDGQMEFYGKLADLEKGLEEDFVRSHRAYLVNLRYVSKYNATNIVLEDGTTIHMAKQKYAQFVKTYMKYIEKIENVEE